MRCGIVNVLKDGLVLETTPKIPLKIEELSKAFQIVYRENLLQFRPENCCVLEYNTETNVLYIYTAYDEMKHNLKVVRRLINKLFLR